MNVCEREKDSMIVDFIYISTKTQIEFDKYELTTFLLENVILYDEI